MDLNKLRLRINEIKSALTEIEQMLYLQEIEVDEETRFYAKSGFSERSTAMQFVDAMECPTSTKNTIAFEFLRANDISYGYKGSRTNYKQLLEFSSYQIYCWLNDDNIRPGRLRGIGFKGTKQVKAVLAAIDDRLR